MTALWVADGFQNYLITEGSKVWLVNELAGERESVGAAQTDDADAASPGRRRECNNRIVEVHG